MRCCHSWSQMGVDTMESSGGHARRLVEAEEKGKFNSLGKMGKQAEEGGQDHAKKERAPCG